jgi:uncharacterized membrane protein YccF (DUF307 family)
MLIVNLIRNILWLLLGGIIHFLLWLILGVLFTITIIGIPFGLKCFKIAFLALAPAGRTVSVSFTQHPILNALWVIIIGWAMSLFYLAAGLGLYMSLIGIPLGKQYLKLAQITMFPFGSDTFSF